MEPAEFPATEYERRLDRLQQSMKTAGLTAMLVVDEFNYRYITGHHTEGWKNHSRPRACWVHSQRDPVLLVPPGESFEAALCSPWRDIEEYGGPTSATVVVSDDALLSFEPALVDALVATGMKIGAACRTGIALGGWAKLEVPFGVILEVQRRLGFAEWLDAAAILWELRMVKSEGEIAYMRAAVQALDVAYASVFRDLEPGMSESLVARSMRANVLLAGAEHPGYTIAASDVRVPRAMGATPGDRVVEDGSVVLIDAGAIVHGYTSDYSRMAAVGTPKPSQEAAYARVANAQLVGLGSIRPGVTAGEVTRAMHEALVEGDATSSRSGAWGMAQASRFLNRRRYIWPQPPSCEKE